MPDVTVITLLYAAPRRHFISDAMLLTLLLMPPFHITLPAPSSFAWLPLFSLLDSHATCDVAATLTLLIFRYALLIAIFAVLPNCR